MPTSPRRRWVQSSIGILLVIAAVVVIWFAYGLHWVKSREQTLQHLKEDGADIYLPGDGGMPTEPWRELPLTLRLVRAEPVSAIILNKNRHSQEDRDHMRSLFPEASFTP